MTMYPNGGPDPFDPSPGRELAADEEHAPGCIRDHFGPGTHTCEPIPIEDFDAPSDVKPTPEQLAAAHAELTGALRLREGPGVGFHAERVSALDAAEREAQIPQFMETMREIGLKCTCTGPEIPDGGQHQVGCPRYVAPEDPFMSDRVGDIARQLMLEQARVRENVARSAVTYVLDEMGRAIDTIRHSVLEQPEKTLERRNQRRAAMHKDIEHVFTLSGEDAESHQRLVSNLVATLIWNGWTKTAPAADAGDGA